MQKTIEYLGQKLITENYIDVPDKIIDNIRKSFYALPEKNKVISNIDSVIHGKNTISEINNYFFSNVQYDVKIYFARWSINEMMSSNELIKVLVARIKKSPKTYSDKSFIKNIQTSFRIGGSGFAAKPTNFKIKVVKDILEKYNINNNYYDFSCGWGVRMMGSIVSNVNYFGTDPNIKLFPKLTELYSEFKSRMKNCPNVDIRCQGSEVFVPEWSNIMGIAFSSPPYFSLEDYKHGDQSVKKDTNYEGWLLSYYEKTIQNIHTYLIKDGHLIININNFKNFDLVGDTKKLCLNNGFELVETETYTNASRVKSNKSGLTENNEGMYVFKKI